MNRKRFFLSIIAGVMLMNVSVSVYASKTTPSDQLVDKLVNPTAKQTEQSRAVSLDSLSVHKNLALSGSGAKASVNFGTIGMRTNDSHGGSSSSSTSETNPPASVPEPFSLILLGTGLTGILAARRKHSATGD